MKSHHLLLEQLLYFVQTNVRCHVTSLQRHVIRYRMVLRVPADQTQLVATGQISVL